MLSKDAVFTSTYDSCQTIYYAIKRGSSNKIHRSYFCFAWVMREIDCGELVEEVVVRVVSHGKIYGRNLYLKHSDLIWWVDQLNKAGEFRPYNIHFALEYDKNDDNVLVRVIHGHAFKKGAITGLALHYARAPRFIGDGVGVIRKMVEKGVPFKSAVRMYLQVPFFESVGAAFAASDSDNNLPLGLEMRSVSVEEDVIQIRSLTKDLKESARSTFCASLSVPISDTELRFYKYEFDCAYDSLCDEAPGVPAIAYIEDDEWDDSGGEIPYAWVLGGPRSVDTLDDYIKLTKEIIRNEK